MKKLRIIVGGYIGLYPTGGATIDYIQYPLGLQLLGHDVYYIEDTMEYPVYQEVGSDWNNAAGCVEYLRSVMEYFGMADKWAYRDIATGECYGMSLHKLMEICRTADIFINISCSTVMRDEYFNIPHRILIDSDPMFTQVTYLDELNGSTASTVKNLIDTHNYLFSFGENIGRADCRIPTFGLNWMNTRQPVCMDLWKNSGPTTSLNFSSVMNWSGREKLLFEDEEWGQKDIEFGKFIDLPNLLPDIKFEVVINAPKHPGTTFNLENIERNKWAVLHPKATVSDHQAYAQFIQHSFAEFSIAKETYVKSNSGWFSCRSACYLAAGKPVVAQDTAWSGYLPSGNGLIAFNDMESAKEAIRSVTSNAKKHSEAAREIANHFFNSGTVLTEMIDKLK
ncbi:MAG: hypothetical protein WKF88_07975 [Ferruginibacter sp.]